MKKVTIDGRCIFLASHNEIRNDDCLTLELFLNFTGDIYGYIWMERLTEQEKHKDYIGEILTRFPIGIDENFFSGTIVESEIEKGQLQMKVSFSIIQKDDLLFNPIRPLWEGK